MRIGLVRLKIHLPGCQSLKEKRSRLKPMLGRLSREFNIAAAETDHQDVWQSAEIGLVTISNDARHTQKSLQGAVNWIETNWPDLVIESEDFEML